VLVYSSCQRICFALNWGCFMKLNSMPCLMQNNLAGSSINLCCNAVCTCRYTSALSEECTASIFMVEVVLKMAAVCFSKSCYLYTVHSALQPRRPTLTSCYHENLKSYDVIKLYIPCCTHHIETKYMEVI
jgi:hypothetical protein